MILMVVVFRSICLILGVSLLLLALCLQYIHKNEKSKKMKWLILGLLILGGVLLLGYGFIISVIQFLSLLIKG
ncbi:MAG: hypothetical protein BGN88_07495 [Clostridiales bacterium 43-6]|nr:MAG: hypothetical protein BGN88_07495 [Clostridiales bacterium 43-6]